MSGMTDHKREIVKRITSMTGRYSAYYIFRDWVEMMALSIQNGSYLHINALCEKREEQYLQIASKYTAEEMQTFSEMFGLLQMSLEENIEDALGDIYMRSGCASKTLGQFFTPYHLSKLTASLNMPDDLDNELSINEPACGGGGLIIAVADILKERGINYQKSMDVVAQDLDWLGVYMTYVQLSLLGVKAVVAQGDTLTEPYVRGYPEDRIFRTPAKMGVLV